MLDDAFEQTGPHSAQEMHLDGLSESSSSSEKMESENGYEPSLKTKSCMRHYYKCNYRKSYRCGLESPCF